MALGPAGDIGKGYQGADYNKNNKSQKTAETSSYLLKMKGISKEIVETSKKNRHKSVIFSVSIKNS